MSVMERRRFLIIANALLVAPRTAVGQSSARRYRVGYLAVGSTKPTGADDTKLAFVAGMRELGYIEGRNLLIEWRGAEGRPERLAGLAEDLVKAKVDVIVSTSDATHSVLKRATTTIPVVMLLSQDPVGRGLIASLSRPGGNFTGLSTVLIDLDAKQLEQLRAVLPNASRLAYLRDDTAELPADVRATSLRKETAAAQALGFELHAFLARNADDLETAFAAMTQQHMEAVHVGFTPFTYRNRARIVALALRSRLPSLVPAETYTEAGGLLSYGIDMKADWRRGAYYVDRILKGARPSDLPVQQPSEFSLVVNGKTAKALGVTLPPEILLRASRVIE